METPDARINSAIVWRDRADYLNEFDLSDAELDELIANGDVELRTDRGRSWARTAPRRWR